MKSRSLLLLLLLLIISLISVTLSEEISKNNLNCILGYLREDDIIDEHSFPSAKYSGDPKNCKKFINEQTQKILNDVKSTFDEGMSSDESACIISDLKDQFYADNLFKEQVYNNYAGMVRSERNDLINENKLIYEPMLEKIMTRCAHENIFNNNFNNSFFKSVTPQTLYCLRRYIIEKDLINTSKIKVHLNPSRINLAGIKCKPLVNVQFLQLENEFKGLLSDDISEDVLQCMINKFRLKKYGDLIVVTKLLKDFNVTEYQAAEFRRQFDKMMENFGALVEDC